MTKFAVSRAIKGLESSGVINRLDEGHFRLWKVAENATGEIPVVAEKTTKVAKITTESCTSNNSHNKEVSEQIKTCLGKEGEAGKAANHQPKRTRIPDPFPLTPGMRAWLAENINGLADIDAVHADFIEYWTNAPSGKAEKLNWELTWQRGMRLAKKWQEDNKSNGTNRLHGRPDHRTDAEILGDSAAYIISKYTNSR